MAYYQKKYAVYKLIAAQGKSNFEPQGLKMVSSIYDSEQEAIKAFGKKVDDHIENPGLVPPINGQHLILPVYQFSKGKQPGFEPTE